MKTWRWTSLLTLFEGDIDAGEENWLLAGFRENLVSMLPPSLSEDLGEEIVSDLCLRFLGQIRQGRLVWNLGETEAQIQNYFKQALKNGRIDAIRSERRTASTPHHEDPALLLESLPSSDGSASEALEQEALEEENKAALQRCLASFWTFVGGLRSESYKEALRLMFDRASRDAPSSEYAGPSARAINTFEQRCCRAAKALKKKLQEAREDGTLEDQDAQAFSAILEWMRRKRRPGEPG